MTSDADLRKVLRMLGQAVYSWGVHLLDDDASDERHKYLHYFVDDHPGLFDQRWQEDQS